MKKTLTLLFIIFILFSVSGCDKANKKVELTFSSDHGVLQKSFYNDSAILYEGLLSILYGVENANVSDDELISYAEYLIRDMENLGSFYSFAKNSFYKKNGETFGVEDSSKIGGGTSYSDIIITGDYVVKNDDEFKQALLSAKSGEIIFIPSDYDIDLSDLRIAENYFAVLKKGVTLASDRGKDGAKGGTIYFSSAHSTLINCLGDNRITGLNLVGVNGVLASGRNNTGSFNGINISNENIKLDNCEISGFSNAGIRVVSQDVVISDCYIHDNGLGISLSHKEAQVVISKNLFANNITDLSATNYTSFDFQENISVGCEKPFYFEEKTNQTFSVVGNTFFDATNTYGEAFVTAIFERNAWDFKSDETLKLIGASKMPTVPVINEALYKKPDITVGVFTGDKNFVYNCLKKIISAPTDRNVVKDIIYDAISELCGFSVYYDYRDSISIKKDGKTYGAYDADGQSSIGGGSGTVGIRTGGDYIVSDLEALISALTKALPDQVVYIPGDTKIDLTPLAKTGKHLVLPAGVTLASNRGEEVDGKISTGAMLYSTERTNVMISAASSSVVEGLIICGSDTSKHITHIIRGTTDGSYTDYYYKLPLTVGIKVDGDGVTVKNCEISGFSNSGVLLNNVKDAHIYQNFIHHNQRNGFGYGVCLSKASEAIIEYNLFNFDRHSVAADGSAGSGYIARYNVQMGEAIYHVFDAHGGGDRGDGTQIACDYVEMYNNTILTDRLPYKRRGIPQQYSKFYNNIVLYPLSYYPVRQLEGANMTMDDNIFGIAQPKIPKFDYNNGKEQTVVINDFNKPLSKSVSAVMLHDGEKNYYTSSELNLRYAFILSFKPKISGGYILAEYGNNLDNGTILAYDEELKVPDGGFVLIFTSENNQLESIYDIVAARYGIIYNTTMDVPGGLIANIDYTNNNSAKITVIQGKIIE